MSEKENDPLLPAANSRCRKWRHWDCMFYFVLLTPVFVLFICSQLFVIGYTNNEITLIPIKIRSNDRFKGVPSKIKGLGKPYNYKELPDCASIKMPESLNTTLEWRKMKECQFSLLQRFFGNPEAVLPNFAAVLYVCDDAVEVNGFEVKELVNSRRVYHVALPKCRDPENLLVTFGIDEDPSAEKQLQDVLENLKIYGTTTSGMKNDIYNHIFSGSVGETDGTVQVSNSNVITSVSTISIQNYVTSELNNTKFVDFLWLNLSNGPFDLTKMLSKNGTFDQMELTFCQIAIEVKADDHNSFYSLMLTVLHQWRHLFLRPVQSEDEQFVRMVIVNATNEHCFKKYIL